MEKLTLVELEKDYAELLASVRKDATDAAEAKFKIEKEGLDAQIEEGKVKTAILEKKDVIRTEKELKSEAEKLFTVEFNASDVPEHLFDKVIAMLNHNKFVSDEVLDAKLWKEACVAEITSWEKAGVTDTVMGGGSFSLKDVDSEATDLAKEAEDDDAMADSLLGLIGNEKGGK